MNEQTDRFIAVDINNFRSATRDISFDVYLRLSEDNYAHVFSKTTGIDYKRLAQYIGKGVNELYIHKDDEPKFKAFSELTADSIFNAPETSNEKKIATLLNMTEQNMSEIFNQFEISEDTARTTEKVVRNYVKMMTENPNSLAVMLRLVSHGEYLYYHSIAVSIFSLVVGRAMGNLDTKTLEILGMGGFLHDVGAAQVKSGGPDLKVELAEENTPEMREHPKLGMQMLEGNPTIPDEVRYIVYQHHEQPNGRGFPNGLRGNVMYYPAKIVGVVDGFASLISKRPGRAALTVEQAINELQSDRSKYDPDIVKVLARVFGREIVKKAA